MSEILLYTEGSPLFLYVTQFAPPNQFGGIITAPDDYDITVDSITVRAWRDLYETDGTFECSVYNTEPFEYSQGSAVAPTGSALQTSTFTKSDIGDPGDFALMTFTFTPVEIDAGESKAFILSYPDYEAVSGVGPQDGNRIGINFYDLVTEPTRNYGIGAFGVGKTSSDWFLSFLWGFTEVTGDVYPNPPGRPTPPPPDIPPFPPPKPPLPDFPDPWWDPPDPVGPTPPGPLPPYWATGGGGYSKNLVVSGNNKIYYEPHTANTVRYSG